MTIEYDGLIPSVDDQHEYANERIPVFKLLAFTLAGFITIMTETIPAGLLPLISHDLAISEAVAGQLISVYALGSVLAAIPVVTATQGWSRKPLFMTAIAGLLIFNTITALSSSYIIVFIARFIAGMSAGIIWGILAGYARTMVAKHLQGRALAIVGIGQPLALCLGIPVGTWLGQMLGWRGVFGIMSVIALLLLIWIKAFIPNIVGKNTVQRKSLKKIFLHPGIRSILSVIFLWILAHSILYTFISPYLSSIMLGNRIDLVLFLFGGSSIIGILITGLYVDRSLRFLTTASLFNFAIAAVLISFGESNYWLIFAGIALWGISFGGAPTLLQTAIADTAGEGADVAQSMLVTIFNLAIAGGGIIGGILLQKIGASSLPIVMFILAIFSFLIVIKSNRHGFKNRSSLSHGI